MNKDIPLENLKYNREIGRETILCPLCGANQFKTIVVEQAIPIVRCAQCALIFANPRPNREELKKFYDQYFPPESAPLWQKQMAEIFLKEGLERIKEYQSKNVLVLSPSPRILDIGSGMGFFLELMKNAGWQVQGVEPSIEAVRHSRSLNVPVYHGTVEYALLNAGFDVVTLWYVMEHVPNPGEILQKAFELLKPKGLLILRVPNQNAGIDRWLAQLGLSRFFLMNPPRHLFDYSPRTITRFLETKGFKVLTIRNGIPRKTGTALELIRRYVWYGIFEVLYYLSGGHYVRGSSMTVYAVKKDLTHPISGSETKRSF